MCILHSYLPGLLTPGFFYLLGETTTVLYKPLESATRSKAESSLTAMGSDDIKWFSSNQVTLLPQCPLYHLRIALKLLSMTCKALHDLYPSYCSSLGFLTAPQPAIIPRAPASRSYSQLPKPTSPFSPLSICTLNSVFQKCHFCPSPFQLPRFSSSVTSRRKLP